MGCWVQGEGIFTNAHTATDSPADACQYPIILWYIMGYTKPST
jgi:hypothetical protein